MRFCHKGICMANTTRLLKIEQYIVTQCLPKQFDGHRFSKTTVPLKWEGGIFEADAVSKDAGVLCVISTSALRTRSGKLGSAKTNKIRSDALFITNVSGVWRKVFVFTEKCMADHFRGEIASKRFPPDIEIIHIPLPDEMQEEVETIRDRSRAEVSPKA